MIVPNSALHYACNSKLYFPVSSSESQLNQVNQDRPEKFTSSFQPWELPNRWETQVDKVLAELEGLASSRKGANNTNEFNQIPEAFIHFSEVFFVLYNN